MWSSGLPCHCRVAWKTDPPAFSGAGGGSGNPGSARQHMPLSISLLRAHPSFKSVSVERGLAGADPQADLSYIGMCHFLFDAVQSFIAAFTPHAATLQEDMPNYTNIVPVIQFNEVLLSQ